MEAERGSAGCYGTYGKSLPLLRAALENAQVTREKFLLWRIHASLGRISHTMGHQETAEKEFSAARALIDELAATVSDETLKANYLQAAYCILRTHPILR